MTELTCNPAYVVPHSIEGGSGAAVEDAIKISEIRIMKNRAEIILLHLE
jgi:hypothetical protein